MATTLSGPYTFDLGRTLQDISTLGAQFQSGETSSRDDLIEAARSLVTGIEPPREAILRMAISEPARNTALRVAVDIGLLDHLLEGGGSPRDSTELATLCRADPVLLNRLLKHLAAMQVIGETPEGLYYPNNLTRALTKPENNGGIIWGVEGIGPTLHQLPAYLTSIGYKNPDDDVKGPWQFAHKTDLMHWPWVAEHPRLHKAFNAYMSVHQTGGSFWADGSFYPVQERLIQGADPEGVLLVDVGGGKGHDLQQFIDHFPKFKGQLVLQDMPEVVADAENLDPRIRPIGHNFFEAQPVKVLHDWTDDRARQILSALTPAMRANYSKLLLSEHVVPEVKASWKVTGTDLAMMGNFASMERSRAQWQSLLSSAGLEITGIFNKEADSESIIEAMLTGGSKSSKV
ncbi:MAG: hypothetical protein Q9165_006188 [Trypethelium subeluteriae]